MKKVTFMLEGSLVYGVVSDESSRPVCYEIKKELYDSSLDVTFDDIVKTTVMFSVVNIITQTIKVWDRKRFEDIFLPYTYKRDESVEVKKASAVSFVVDGVKKYGVTLTYTLIYEITSVAFTKGSMNDDYSAATNKSITGAVYATVNPSENTLLSYSQTEKNIVQTKYIIEKEFLIIKNK